MTVELKEDVTVELIPPRSFFDAPLFITDGTPVDVPGDTQWLCNQGGRSVYSKNPEGKQISVTPEDPSLSRGKQYRGITFGQKKIDWGTQWAYILYEFDFKTAPDPVVYEPLWAHKDRNAQAFGFTIVHDGECVPFSEQGLVDSPSTYGVYAGYQSPYIGSDRSRQLLTVNATDLEHHKFSHVFCSIDTVPLVISVGRWRPSLGEIWLADLWVRPGDLLLLPPKVHSDEYIDMHGDRNSALACWGNDEKSFLNTRTTLGASAVFEAEATKPHYHEEKTHTIHTRPAD